MKRCTFILSLLFVAAFLGSCDKGWQDEMATLKERVNALENGKGDNNSPSNPTTPGTDDKKDDTGTPATPFVSTGSYENHAYVDLGLTSKTLWATMNIGANSPVESGNYFAWGETKEQAEHMYNNNSYSLSEGEEYSPTYTRYNDKDNKKALDSDDDAATKNWGGKWRMPSREDFEELVEQCYWQWTTKYNGKRVMGYIIYKAKHNDDKGFHNAEPFAAYSLADAHIFLPMTGNYNEGELDLSRFDGTYWSRTLYFDEDYPSYGQAINLMFMDTHLEVLSRSREDGYPVRAVCKDVE